MSYFLITITEIYSKLSLNIIHHKLNIRSFQQDKRGKRPLGSFSTNST